MKTFLIVSFGIPFSVLADVKYEVADPGGIHKDYTDGGKTKGVGSASYDYWISDGPWNAPPAAGFGDQTGDNEGAVLLALNPYTGEIFTQIAANEQYFNPAGTYSGGGHSSFGSSSEFAAAGGIYPDAENNPLPGNAGAGDMIVFTTELRPNGGGDYVVGMYAMATADGAILGEFDPGFAGINTYNPHFLSSGETVGSSGSFDGADIRVYCGYISWGGAAWVGQFGTSGQRGIGFEMDGHKGWIRIDISGDRAGLVLKEYYFAAEPPPAPAELAITEIVNAPAQSMIGPGADITDARNQDPANQGRLNVDRAATTLAAGRYLVPNWRLKVNAHTAGTVTPMLLSGAPSSYTTIWIGAPFNPASNEIHTVPETGGFTLEEETEVRAGFFTAGGGSAIIGMDANNSGTGNSRTDHDLSPAPPGTAGDPVNGFSHANLRRTYAFGINVASTTDSDGSLAITFTSNEGGVYAVDYKERLDMKSWLELDDGIIGARGSTTWINDNELQLARRSGFYRVRDVSP